MFNMCAIKNKKIILISNYVLILFCIINNLIVIYINSNIDLCTNKFKDVLKLSFLISVTNIMFHNILLCNFQLNYVISN